MKDRYGFDQEFNREKYRKNYFDDKFLSLEEDAEISARRQARIEKANRDVVAFRVKDLKTAEEIRKQNKRKTTRGRMIVVGVLFAAVIAFVAVSGSKLTKLQIEKREAQKKLDQLNQKTEQLEAELQELDTDEYIENAARTELHMIYNGEVMYVVNPDLKTVDSSSESSEIKAK